MKEFKCRVWDKDNKKWITDGCILFKQDQSNHLITIAKDDLLVIQQFTGIKDKNHKEIYDGDIVKHIYNRNESGFGIAQIGWDDMYAGWSIQNSNSFFGSGIMRQPSKVIDGRVTYPENDEELEVIGNIFENEDLLKIKAH